MNCAKCDSSSLKVTLVRKDTVESIMRRRQCQKCGHVWFTAEIEVPRDGVKWSGDKLMRKPGFKQAVFL